MAKGSGGTGRGGGSYRGPDLTSTRKNVRVGDYIYIEGTRQRAPVSGVVQKVRREFIEVASSVFGHPVTIDVRISRLSGGYLKRGNMESRFL